MKTFLLITDSMKALFYFPLSLACLTVVFPLSAGAQIVPDQSLGAEGSVVVPALIKGLPSDQLEGGALRGGNLFHSFGEFSVPDGRGAYFANPAGVGNIFSRVTGGNISQILGTLGVLGNANLYFLNPNGIVFGPNARLDLRGSFLATTAASFIFENGFEFSAVNPSAPLLLTVNIPIGLNFRQGSSAEITNQSSLSAGQDLTLAGNNLDLQGQVISGKNLTLTAEDTVKIRDSLDSPFIAAAGGELRVQGSQSVDIFALNHPESGFFSRGSLTLSSTNSVGGDARFTSAGSFRIEGLNGALGELTSPNDPVIRAGGDVLIGSYEGASLHIIAGGKVEITDYVLITGADGEYGLQEAVSLADGTTVNIDGKTQPTLDIRAGVSPEAIGEPFFNGSGADFFGEPLDFPESPTSADISVGSLLFRDGEFNPITGQVLLTNQYFPNPNLTGDIQVQSTLGDLGFGAIETGGGTGGGHLTIFSRNNVNILGSIDSTSSSTGGTILINALGEVTVRDSIISVVGNDGGNMNIKAQKLTINNSQILAGIAEDLGDQNSQAGNIIFDINKTLNVIDSFIFNDLNFEASGNSGKVIINAQDVFLSNSAITSDVIGRGNSGGVSINASNLALGNGGSINTSIYGEGEAGAIQITAIADVKVEGENVEKSPSNIASLVLENARGKSGNVSITSANLTLSNGGTIASSSLGEGDAGSIQIFLSKDLTIDGENSRALSSRITSQVNPDGFGKSGEILIRAANVSLTQGGEINSSIFGKGNAGSITLEVTENISIKGENSNGFVSGIFSGVQNEAEGNSGEIRIDVANLMIANGGRVTSSVFGEGAAGIIRVIASGDIEIQGENSQAIPSGIYSSLQEGGVGSSGGIVIEADNLSLTQGGFIDASTLGEGNAGPVEIQILGNILLGGETSQGLTSSINSGVASTASGDSGGITLTTTSLLLERGGKIDASTFGRGNSGAVVIKAREFVTVTGESSQGDTSFIASQVNSTGVGDSGGITLETGALLLEQGGFISASTFGEGDSGAVVIKAAESVTITGEDSQGDSSFVASAVGETGMGNSGGITLETGSLLLEQGGNINASTLGNGNAGDIDIVATGQTSISGASFNDTLNRDIGGILAFTTSAGTAGTITLNTPLFNLSDGAGVEAFTQGEGGAGSIVITAPQAINIGANSRISVETSAAGRPGDIIVTTDTLTLGTDSQLSATATATATNPQGGGSINLNAQTLNISGRLGIFAETQGDTPAGNLTINPNDNNPDLNIRFTDNGFISARTTAGGQGGNIDISAPNVIDIRGQGRITAETSGAGNAGSIEFTSQRLNLADGVEVSATTTGTGDAGNIRVNTPVNLTIGDNSRLTAETQSAGRAGDITVTAETISLGTNAELSARATQTSTNQEGGGSINLNASQLNIRGQLGIFAETQGQAPAGNLTIRPELTPDLSIRFTEEGFISALTTASGQGGNIDISAPDLIDIRGQGRITTETSGTGNAGVINLNSQRLNLQDSVAVSASTSNAGQGGSLTITAPESIRLQGAQLSTQATSAGEAGDINLTTRQLELTENGLISASSDRSRGGNVRLQNLENLTVNQGEISASTVDGSAGSLTVNSNQLAVNRVALDNGSLAVKATGSGNSGNLAVNARTVELDNGAEISASTNSGVGESVTLTNVDTLILNNGSEITATTQTGRAGSITVNSGQSPVNALQINQNSAISAQATGERGEAGSVALNTRTLTLGNGAVSASNQSGTVGGDVTLENVENLTVNQGEISASTVDGSAGSLTVNSEQLAVNRVALDNGSLAVKATGTGNSGNLAVNARTVELNNGAEISASTNSGAGESVTLTNVDTLTLNNGSQITATTQTGRAGSITVNSGAAPVNALTVNQNSAISAQASEERGEAGSVALNTRNLTLQNGAVSASNQSGTVGGDVTLESLENLTVNQGEISASTVDGSAGSLTVNSNQAPVNRVSLDQGSLAVKATGAGNSGNLAVNARTVALNNGAEISASTNSGAGGNITLPQLEILDINNSQISASTATGSAGSILINSAERVGLENQGRITVEATEGGTAGNLELTTDTLTVTENSRVSVSSLTGQAGNIDIRTKDLLLDRGAITAETGTSDQESGANINLSASNLLTLRLQNESLISATANADADGGNITIDAPFLLAYPATGPDGNDIIAKAVRGAGGQITVNALGIFGISEGRAIAGNQSNNFDASSEFGAPGVVQLNQAVDPNRGLTQLPETVTDPNELIAQNVCRRGKESELTQTGKGGLPPTLEDDFQGEPTLPPLVEPVAPQPSAPLPQGDAPISSRKVQPAQGWIMNAQGQIELVSYQTQGLEVRRRPGKVTQCP